jgi:hypothetical protein
MRAVAALLITLIAACGTKSSTTDAGSTPSIRASDFDQSCTQNTDCVAVEDDTPCCTVCPNAAVNKAAVSPFNAERSKQAALCSPADRMCGGVPCYTADHAACSAGKCVFVRCGTGPCPDADAGADASGD